MLQIYCKSVQIFRNNGTMLCQMMVDYRKYGGWGTLCIKEHFTSRNTLLLKSWTHFAAQHTLQSHNLLLSTPCSLTPFATQNPLLLITPCFSAHSAPQNTLLLSTLCFKEHFTPRNTLLLNTLCFLTHFAPWNTLLLRTLCSLEHFAPQHIMLLGIHLTIMWNRCMKQDSDLNFRVKMSKKNCIRHVSESRHWKYSKKQSVPGCKVC